MAKDTVTIPKWWDSWSESERLGWREMQHEYEEADRLFAEIEATVSPDVRMKVSQYGDQRQNAAYSVMGLTLSRLRRYLPQFADLIDWAGFNGADWHD